MQLIGIARHELSSARADFTFHGNARDTRYGWLRLTPAYSRKLVGQLIAERTRPELPVLDPFSGTGTTALCCAEQGVACDAVELNPFLVWLGRCKIARYTPASINGAEATLDRMQAAARDRASGRAWVPALSNIEKWWDGATLDALSRAFAALQADSGRNARARDLARLCFCRALIECANVSFGHQSMSFQKTAAKPLRDGRAKSRQRVAEALRAAFVSLSRAALHPLESTRSRIVLGDARDLPALLGSARYGTVITSPPYANRMSYIRELRPYMYWLGHLRDAPSAGILDWRAIGGTWGSATSNLATYTPPAGEHVPYRNFAEILARIAVHSPILSLYVERYFYDMLVHVRGLRRLIVSGGRAHYIVGNSKFYEVLLPVQDILAALFAAEGFEDCEIVPLRKRTSKAELFEYRVSARVA